MSCGCAARCDTAAIHLESGRVSERDSECACLHLYIFVLFSFFIWFSKLILIFN